MVYYQSLGCIYTIWTVKVQVNSQISYVSM